MDKYLYEFQLQLNTTTTTSSIINQPLLNVFKKKNLQNIDINKLSEYEQPEEPQLQPEFEFNNPTKSKLSCIRCRKYKKKCSRTYPECSNCESSSELCKYIPRKSRNPPLQSIDSNTYTMKRRNNTLPNLLDSRITETNNNHKNTKRNNSLPNINNSSTTLMTPSSTTSSSSSSISLDTYPNYYSYDKRIKPNDFNSILN